jgi:hypothetical protein
MKIRDIDSIRYVNSIGKSDENRGVDISEDIRINWDEITAGLRRLESRFSTLIGKSFEQDLFVGSDCIFYGTDDYEPGSLYGVRRMDYVPGSWLVKNNSEFGAEALASDPLNRFEDAWKQMVACIAGKVFRRTDNWRNVGRTGLFFDRVPEGVICSVLTREVAQKIYRIDEGWRDVKRSRLVVDRAESGSRILWQSAVHPDAWIDSPARRISTPPVVWGFNLGGEEFVDLVFDWALSPAPLGGMPLSHIIPD